MSTDPIAACIASEFQLVLADLAREGKLEHSNILRFPHWSFASYDGTPFSGMRECAQRYRRTLRLDSDRNMILLDTREPWTYRAQPAPVIAINQAVR